MNQIFHHYEKWEDWKCGFYDSLNGEEKEIAGEIVVEVFSNPHYTELLMNNVIKKWPYSCEQNLSNSNMNRIAWLGQSCLCLEFGIPQTITMNNWRNVPKEFRDKADNIAKQIIENWIDTKK